MRGASRGPVRDLDVSKLRADHDCIDDRQGRYVMVDSQLRGYGPDGWLDYFCPSCGATFHLPPPAAGEPYKHAVHHDEVELRLSVDSTEHQ